MTDYGRPLAFGLFLTPSADDPRRPVDEAQLADGLGLDLVAIQDHPYEPRFLEMWTLLTWLAARTVRIRFFPDTATLLLRPPAMLAKSAASLDRLSHGRIELGIGIGAFPEAIARIGGQRLDPPQAVDSLEEAIAVMRLMWTGDPAARFEGRYHRMVGVAGPPPVHPIAIWIGAYRPRMLELTGRLGDGWVPTMAHAPPSALHAMHHRIDRAAEKAGRDPATITRIYNITGRITEGSTTGLLHGPVEHWVETLSAFAVEYGMDSFVFGPSGETLRQLRLFAEEVVPGVREQVARLREERGEARGDAPPKASRRAPQRRPSPRLIPRSASG